MVLIDQNDDRALKDAMIQLDPATSTPRFEIASCDSKKLARREHP
jgi:hypothetical protein